MPNKEAPPHTCKRDHTEITGHTTAVDELMTLPPSQRNPWRHICAACAFEKGFLKGVEYAMERINEAGSQILMAQEAVQNSRKIR